MATSGRTIRRGLPRTPGGDAWPPASASPASASPASASPASASPASASPVSSSPAGPGTAARAEAAGPSRVLRRGLPRTDGGAPWPPAEAAVLAHPSGRSETAPAAGIGSAAAAGSAAGQPAADSALDHGRENGGGTATPMPRSGEATRVRRGLARTPGGEPWPPASYAPRIAPPSSGLPGDPGNREQTPAAPAEIADAVARGSRTGSPATLPVRRTAWRGAPGDVDNRSSIRARTDEPGWLSTRLGPYSRAQWLGITAVGGVVLVIGFAMLVAATRFALSVDPLRSFVETYPGEYHLPESAPVGIPSWLGWQHFFNVFLMVLIIRSGLGVRSEKKPPAMWSPRGNSRRRISLTLWFHQALDILWIVNGVAFVVLLFATGHWMRIVPTSWEVFPNAFSAILQYISLDWPTENGWVNYNSIQQLAYFTTVFIAAPLAVATGVRMSGIWPKNAARLNRLYPVEWARKLHFPTMIYFVLFIAVHVALVLATGALRNLNHMYAAQGSTDPAAFADNWAGFWIFVGSLAVIGGAWVAARPLVLAPIARLFGSVSAR